MFRYQNKRRYINIMLYFFSVMSILPLTHVQAHPHSWVDLKTDIVGNKTHILGFNMSWTFDAMTSAYMLDGEDLSAKNKARTLAKMTETLLENIHTERYFTHFYDGDTRIDNALAGKATLTQSKIKLTLHFYLPLLKPKVITPTPMTLLVFESGYYVDMSWESANDIQLSPELSQRCSLALILPTPTEEQSSYAMSLSADESPNYEQGKVFSQMVKITCHK